MNKILKEYKEAFASPIMNYKKVYVWFFEQMRIDFELNNILCDSHLDLFTEKLGKPHFLFRYEFAHKGWKISFDGERYFILTAKGKGTSLEVVESDTITDEKVLRFLKEFYLKGLFDYEPTNK